MFGARKFQALVSWGVLVFVLSGILVAQTAPWSTEKAATWYEQQPWLVGSNYIPDDAINELEMWQAESFDAPEIDKELGWAEDIGMNTCACFCMTFYGRKILRDSGSASSSFCRFHRGITSSRFSCCL